MKVEITLKDEDGDSMIVISSCDAPGYVFLTIASSDETVQVNIEEIKLALRKICAK